MNRYQKYLMLVIGIVSGSHADAWQLPEKQPNIIFILADDLGIGDVSAFNKESQLKTIHIDRLAEEGIKFTDAHTSSSVCTPTRYGILTGRYNWRSELKKGVLSGYSRSLIPQSRLTVARLLKDQRYHTAFIGKWHLGWDWNLGGEAGEINSLDARPDVDFSQPVSNGPQEIGFEYSYGFSGSLDMAPYVYVENGKVTSLPSKSTVSTDYKGFWRRGPTSDDFVHADVLQHFTQKAIRYVDDHAQDNNPFFLYFALPAPHTPILPSSPYLGKSNTNFYGDFVLETDGVVGQILAALEKNGIRENTLIVFTSDNGCSPRAGFEELEKVGHNPNSIYRGHKADLYEGGHRVPFIVSWPAHIRKGTSSSSLICTTDFMATVADVVKAPLPDSAGEDSFSFLSVLSGSSEEYPSDRAVVHHSVEGRFAIRKEYWKLVLWPGSGGWSSPKTGEETNGLPPFQLFNLDADPSETENLALTNTEKVKELEALLVTYIQNGRSTPGTRQKNDGAPVWKELKGIGPF